MSSFVMYFMTLSCRFHVAVSNVEPNDERQASFVVKVYFMSVPTNYIVPFLVFVLLVLFVNRYTSYTLI
jgi:hypothetical protein